VQGYTTKVKSNAGVSATEAGAGPPGNVTAVGVVEYAGRIAVCAPAGANAAPKPAAGTVRGPGARARVFACACTPNVMAASCSRRVVELFRRQ
jgi:hypothetical protein